MKAFLKDWTLLVALAAGALFHGFFSRFTWVAPYLIFCMLLLTFCRLTPRDLRLHPLHLTLLGIQLGAGVGLYLLLRPVHPLLAQGACIVALAPAATASAVITAMLGGNIAFMAAFVLMSNLLTAVAAPVVLSLVGTAHADWPLSASMLLIARQVAPTLILPLLAAWTLRRFAPRAHAWLLRRESASFYLWALSFTTLMGGMFNFILHQDNPDYGRELQLAALAVAVCSLQFLLGKRLGDLWGERVAAGQALGQKNTVLAIWMAFQYMNPVAAVCPAAYAVWQNLINAFQLWRKRREDRRIAPRVPYRHH